MKKAAFLILIIAMVYSCKKDSSSPNTPAINISGLPKNYTFYDAQDHTISFDTYKYDSNNNLAGVSVRQTDTAGGIIFVDSGSYFFNVDQAADLPTGYTSIYRKHSDSKAQVETHTLFFNSQKQVIKDSGVTVISGNNPNAATKYYTYTGNTIISKWWANSAQGWNAYLIDSVNISNGNVSSFYQYNNGGSGNNWVLASQYTETNYSNYKNPFYDPGLSYSFGAFLLLEGINDFLSKSLVNVDGFTWVTDNQGRVVSGMAADGSYVQFTYQ